MGTKEVKFSDLSGQLLADDDQPVRLVVLEHPDLNSGPVALEALPHEVRPAVDAALSVAVFELHAGDDEPRRVVVDVGDFDALATDQPMKALCQRRRGGEAERQAHADRRRQLRHDGTCRATAPGQGDGRRSPHRA